MKQARRLKNTHYSIDRDYPLEISAARKKLWPEVKELRRIPNSNVQLKFPAKIVMNGRVIKDSFPQWDHLIKLPATVGLSYICVEESVNQPPPPSPPPPPPPPPQVIDSYNGHEPGQPLNQIDGMRIDAPLFQNQMTQRMWTPAPSALTPNSISNIIGKPQSKVHGSQPQNQVPQLSYAGAVQGPTVSNKVTKTSYMLNTQRNQSSSRLLSQDNLVRNLPLHLDSGPSGTHTLELSQSSQQNCPPSSPSLINPNFPSDNQQIIHKVGTRIPLDTTEHIPLSQPNMPRNINDCARSESVERIRSRGRHRSVVGKESRGRSTSLKA